MKLYVLDYHLPITFIYYANNLVKKKVYILYWPKINFFLIRLGTCDHVQVHACNELIIKSVNFLLKIFNIVITFEHVYLTKNDWKPFKKITDNKFKKKQKQNAKKKKKKKTTCIEMYNDQTQILYA